jgi:hypothetical protein
MTTQDQMRLADVDPLVLTIRAGTGPLVAALLLDALIPLACLISAIVAIATGHGALGALLLAATVVFSALWAIQTARTGRSIGGLALGIRTVKRSTGVAAGASFLPALFTGGLGAFDVRRGRDPHAPALAPFEFPERTAQAPAPRRSTRPGTPIIQLDSGERLALESALVLGRQPAAPLDAPAEVYQWPDLSRTLSKSHARLEWDGTRVWVTDLGSTNGTFVQTGGTAHPLLPYQRTPLASAATLELGDRTVTVKDAS